MGQQHRRVDASRRGQALIARAVQADARKDFASAAQLAAEATAADANDAGAWRLLGVFREKLGDYAASIAAYERALTLTGGDADLARDIARLASLLNLPALAERFLLRAWDQDPSSLEIINDLAYAYCAQSRFDDAITLLRAALSENPGVALLWNTLGCVLYESGQAAQSLVFFDEATRLAPDLHNGYYNRSNARRAIGDLDGALDDADRAIALGAGSLAMAVMYRHARATHLLTAGRIGDGWDAYAVRNDPAYPDHVHHALATPAWTPGEPLAGRRLLVVAEQGVGDEVLFASLLADIADEIGPAGQLTVAVDARLVALFQRSFEATRVVAHESRGEGGCAIRSVPDVAPDAHDAWARLGDFLSSCRRSVADFPDRPEGFLKADPRQVQAWRQVLAELGPGPKVGVIWQSLLMTAQRQKFYAPLDLWGPVFAAPGVTFINLQVGDCDGQLCTIADAFGAKVHTLPGLDLRQDLDGIAALCKALDLTVGPATATTNLSAAVGAPTCFLTTPDAWTRLGTPAFPWYPQARAFAGVGSYDWAAVMDAVGAALLEDFGGWAARDAA